MFARMTSRLSYANVIATIAVFFALAGGAYAGVHLAKNSVGPKNIKKGAVKTKQLANGAVTAAKVKGDSLTGAQIKESSLGIVPNSKTVGGNAVKQIHYRVASGTPTQTLFSLGGLTVTASCPAAQTEVTLDATTDTDGSIIGISVVEGVDDVFDAGEHLIAPLDDYEGTISYGRGASGTPVVTANFLANRHGTNECAVVGTVISG